MSNFYQKLRETPRAFYRFFRSAKMTATIIAVLTTLFAIGLIIPQKALFRSGTQYDSWKTSYPLLSRLVEQLHLNEIYVAPVTVFFLTLFFTNLVVVIADRVPVILKKTYLLRDAVPAIDLTSMKNSSATRRLDMADADETTIANTVRAYLKKKFWFPLGKASPAHFTMIKNRYSPFGFLLFHLSFLFCLIGGLLVMYTRFSGDLVLTEGQEFHADMAQFRRINREPKIFMALPNLEIALKKVTPRYEKGTATDLSVLMDVAYWGEHRMATVKVNEPVKRGPMTILAKDIGVSPLFVLRSADGTMIDGGYVSLNVLNGDEDSFVFQNVAYRFFVRFYPDYVEEDGVPLSRSNNLVNPVARVRIEKEGKTVYSGKLPLGQGISFDSHSLSFEGIRYWVEFDIIREYGSAPLFAGFGLGVIGLIMRLVFPQKTLKIAVERTESGSVVYLQGHCEYYQYGFLEELERLIVELQSAFAGGKSALQPPAWEA